ncbi:uncharacterized protein PRCAT00000854001 [Priceomyces carsonii]|uniref:uncharacterized protein n=1 Tax=Priceomyces carsonii TaxID=28549 RepID=UPI002ED7BDE0|nr:unnamed protein product [Priceomyces carsonii]
MVDSKSKKTINKLGKLFGVLSTTLVNENGELENGAAESTDQLGTNVVSNNQEDDIVTPLRKEAVVSPSSMSPKLNQGNSNSKIVPTTISNNASPSNSLLSSGEIVHPQPQSLAATSNTISSLQNLTMNNSGAPLVSRTPSAIKRPSSGVVLKSNPVSRSSSVKARPPLLKDQSSQAAAVKPRFRMLENGNHEHNLKSAKRQEKLSNMIKDLLGAKKLRSEAKSAVPNILNGVPQTPNQDQKNKPPTLFAGLVNQFENNVSPYHGPALGPPEQQDSRSFVEKYGRCLEVIGRGSFGTVRISHKKLDGSEEILYAVKEFKRRPSESEKKYNRRLTSEFCISSSLKNINIIDTLDLLKDANGDYCEVMEFCSGGDLYTLIITAGKLEYAEADCFFKQLIRGVNYMHEMGVCHRDLKPENLLLTQNGVLKITDFGNGECFKMAWESEIQLSEGICGSSPYIAPEEFSQDSFDPRGVDIWACGVIYMAMRTGRQLWKLADPRKDEFFEEYLLKRKDATGYEPIESLKRARCRNVIYSILDPKPERRINGKQILNSEWGREIKVCEAGDGKKRNLAP